jgi:Fur family ferric uptake transcriptional regulator
MSADPSSLMLAVRSLLHARGERMTRPRQAVLEVLAADRGHLSAEEVVAAVAARDSAVHRASVYRTLDALTQLGVVQHVHLGHGATAYHLLADERDHVHLQCAGCHAIVDVPLLVLSDVADELDAEYGFALDLGHVALSGRCRACR